MLPQGHLRASLHTEVLFGHMFAPILRNVARDKGIEGELAQYETPDWLPLALVAGQALLQDFMWMHEVRLADDRRLHAYKHIDTRRYVHPDAESNAFVYGEDDRYRPASLASVLRAVFRPLWGDLRAAPGAPARAKRALDLAYDREEDADTIRAP